MLTILYIFIDKNVKYSYNKHIGGVWNGNYNKRKHIKGITCV